MKNTNLIIDDAAFTANGRQQIISWLGGQLNAELSGVMEAGVEVKLQVSIKAPADPTTLTDNDWVTLEALQAPGLIQSNLNACLLSANVTGAAGATKVRLQVN